MEDYRGARRIPRTWPWLLHWWLASIEKHSCLDCIKSLYTAYDIDERILRIHLRHVDDFDCIWRALQISLSMLMRWRHNIDLSKDSMVSVVVNQGTLCPVAATNHHIGQLGLPGSSAQLHLETHSTALWPLRAIQSHFYHEYLEWSFYRWSPSGGWGRVWRSSWPSSAPQSTRNQSFCLTNRSFFHHLETW